MTELATFVDGPCTDGICGSGSTIGPDGALYVTDSTTAGFSGSTHDGNGEHIRRRPASADRRRDRRRGRGHRLPGSDRLRAGERGERVLDRAGGVIECSRSRGHLPARPALVVGTTQATLIADIYTWSEDNPPVNTGSSSLVDTRTRWSGTGAGSWSPTGTTTGCCAWASTATSACSTTSPQNVVPTGLETHGSGACWSARPARCRTHPEEAVLVALRRKGGPVVPNRLGCPAAGRRGGRPREPDLRSCAGGLAVRGPGRQGRLPRRAEHRSS